MRNEKEFDEGERLRREVTERERVIERETEVNMKMEVMEIIAM